MNKRFHAILQQGEPIARTGFVVSLSSYGGFFFLDWVRPGFVSNVFSVHVFLLAVFVFGMWWGSVKTQTTTNPIIEVLFVMLLSVSFATVTWVEGSAFADLRVLMVFVAAAVPVVGYQILKRT